MAPTESARRHDGRIHAPVSRPTSWWLAALRRRAATMYENEPAFDEPTAFASEAERQACIGFFNAALRAEESGRSQAHRLAAEVRGWDPELAEALVLYGNEEGWHDELLRKFLVGIGGQVRPMGRVTRTFYEAYARATELESIMLTNLMFETIGSTTYRIALGRVQQPMVRRMLAVLARDESFHVPLNVHFIREILRHKGPTLASRIKLQGLYLGVFAALLGSAAASRRVAEPFDHITFKELSVAYAANLGRLFLQERDLALRPPRLVLRALGLTDERLRAGDDGATSIAAAERAVERHAVEVTALEV